MRWRGEGRGGGGGVQTSPNGPLCKTRLPSYISHPAEQFLSLRSDLRKKQILLEGAGKGDGVGWGKGRRAATTRGRRARGHKGGRPPPRTSPPRLDPISLGRLAVRHTCIWLVKWISSLSLIGAMNPRIVPDWVNEFALLVLIGGVASVICVSSVKKLWGGGGGG